MTTTPVSYYGKTELSMTRRVLMDLLANGSYSLYAATTGYRLSQMPVDNHPTHDQAKALVAKYVGLGEPDLREQHYAELIAPVAAGMLALSSIDDGNQIFPFVRQRESRDVVAALTQDPESMSFVVDWLDSLPMSRQLVKGLPGEEAFGPNCMLGLRALVLNYNPFRPEKTSLCIVLPDPWQFEPTSDIRKAHGMRVIKIDRYGRVSFDILQPHTPDPTFVAKALYLYDEKWTGTCQRQSLIHIGHRNGPDSPFGFPGAHDYFQRWLPLLGPYLIALVEAEQSQK